MSRFSRSLAIRRIRADEWAAIRALRIESTSDPDAAIAFLERPDEVGARPDEFWIERARIAASGDSVATLVATRGDHWIGALTVIVRQHGHTDHLGRPVAERRADVVGVYVRPSERGRGVVDQLIATAAQWVAAQGLASVRLDVHRDNGRAQAAYRRVGFRPTGIVTSSAIGDEIEMELSLAPPDPEADDGSAAGMVPT
ncbi:MAG TPA: GNAT family N-acetyltransferase [Microbacterium sp.]|nr:GNAT family N-acetyltransferase [Microbacterium sp.]